MTDSPQTGTMIPRSLFVYSLLYGGLVVLAGVLGTKISEIGPLHVESGIFAFLMLVVLSSAVAELHGKDAADRLVRYGFIPLILSMALIFIVIRIPPAPFWTQQEQLQPSSAGRTPAACRADFLRHFADIERLCLYPAERRRQRARCMAARADRRAAFAGARYDIVHHHRFYGVVDPGTGQAMPIVDIMTGQIIAKLTLVVVFVPLLITACVKLGQRLTARRPEPAI